MLRQILNRAQVKGLKESRLTMRGDGDRDPIFSEDVWTRPDMYSFHRLVRVQLGKVCTRRYRDSAQDLQTSR